MRSQAVVSGSLLRVVKDDAERVPASGTQAADAVTEVDAKGPAFAFCGAMVHCESHRVALSEGQDFGPRQSLWVLFNQQKFAAGKIAPRFSQQDHDLHRKHEISIQVLMHATVVAVAIL